MSNSSATTEEAKEQAQHSSKPVEEENAHYSFHPKRKQLSSLKSVFSHNSSFHDFALADAPSDWAYFHAYIFIIMRSVNYIAIAKGTLRKALTQCSKSICDDIAWPNPLSHAQRVTIETLCQDTDPTQYLYSFYVKQDGDKRGSPQYYQVLSYIFNILFRSPSR